MLQPQVDVTSKRYRLNHMIRDIQARIICQKSCLGIEAMIIGEFIMCLADHRVVGKAGIHGGYKVSWGGQPEGSLVGGLLVNVFNESGEGPFDGGLPFGHPREVIKTLRAR